MRFRSLNIDFLAALTVGVLAATMSDRASAGEPQHGAKIEISEPRGDSPIVVSNLNRLNPAPGNFKQVKEDLMRPFGSLNPRNSALNFSDDLPMPQQRPQFVPNKHAQELLDKRRNWAFTSYEDLNPQPTLQEAFGIKQFGADGKEKKTGSVVDKYYDSLGQKNLTGTNRYQAGVYNSEMAEFYARNGFNPLGSSFQGSDPFMKQMFSPEGSDAVLGKKLSAIGNPNATGGIFGSQDETRLQQERLNDFKRNILGDTSVPAASMVLPGMPDDSLRQSKSAADALLAQQMSRTADVRRNAGPQLIAVDPTANALHTSINDDLTARALGLPNPVKTTEAPKPPTTATTIETQLDPFTGNRMKRKF
jgi:hypothetical protein